MYVTPHLGAAPRGVRHHLSHRTTFDLNTPMDLALTLPLRIHTYANFSGYACLKVQYLLPRTQSSSSCHCNFSIPVGCY